MKKFFVSFIIAIVVIFSCVDLYIQNVSKIFSPRGNVYQTEQIVTNADGYDQKMIMFLEFTEDGLMNIICADEYYSVISKSSYKYNLHIWDKIGSVYFKSDTLLSATLFKEDATPGTLKSECVQSRGFYVTFDEETSFVTYEDTEILGTYLDGEIWFYEDAVFFLETIFSKIDEIDPVCNEMIRLFIDNDETFYQYN